MHEHEQPIARASSDLPRVGWREVVTREHLPGLLVLCLAIWLHAANTMLAATTLPEAVHDIGGLGLISWALALYLMGSIVAATAVSAYVASAGLRRTMRASTLVYILGCGVCATAPAMPVLLAGHTVQGLGGGALVALVFIAQERFFPNRLVPRIDAAEHAANRLRTRRCPEWDHREWAGLRSDDTARGLADGGVLGVCRIHAAGIARNSDCVALQ